MSNPNNIIHLSCKNIFFDIHKLGGIKMIVLAVEREREKTTNVNAV